MRLQPCFMFETYLFQGHYEWWKFYPGVYKAYTYTDILYIISSKIHPIWILSSIIYMCNMKREKPTLSCLDTCFADCASWSLQSRLAEEIGCKLLCIIVKTGKCLEWFEWFESVKRNQWIMSIASLWPFYKRLNCRGHPEKVSSARGALRTLP